MKKPTFLIVLSTRGDKIEIVGFDTIKPDVDIIKANEVDEFHYDEPIYNEYWDTNDVSLIIDLLGDKNDHHIAVELSRGKYVINNLEQSNLIGSITFVLSDDGALEETYKYKEYNPIVSIVPMDKVVNNETI